MMMGFRMPGANTKDNTIAKLVAGILYNQQAGLIDLDLNQQQKFWMQVRFTANGKNTEFLPYQLIHVKDKL